MKKMAFMAMAALMMTACQSENAYTIVGTVDAAGEGDSISLQLVEGRKLVDLQKVPVVNGKFEFKGVATACRSLPSPWEIPIASSSLSPDRSR